jgi:hypothetical protein
MNNEIGNIFALLVAAACAIAVVFVWILANRSKN